MVARRIRDNSLIDALEALSSEEFNDRVWRVVRQGRDPILGSSAQGRWDDGSFDVLYTSTVREGAIAEMYFHLMKGQPVMPSRMAFNLYEIEAHVLRALRLINITELANLGVSVSDFGRNVFPDHKNEYPRTQEIAEAAHFLDYQGLIVPNARWDCDNVVIFSDRIEPADISIENEHGEVNWTDWKNQSKGSSIG